MPEFAMTGLIRQHLETGAAVQHAAAQQCAPAIAAAAELVIAAFRNGNRLFLCGNGGSAADCQHLAAEFMNALVPGRLRPPLPAIALTTDTSLLTASANDLGFDGVFQRQVEALGRDGDVLIAISTSGDSPNVLLALERARAQGLRTIALTGASGGQAVGLAEVTISIPSEVTQHIQETHIAVGHILCDLVERALFPEAHPGLAQASRAKSIAS
jgi:D-sedoheptulose 7-phosphate isomerase